MLDCVIYQVPKTDPTFPIVGPYILKRHLQNNGHTCKVFDINLDIYSKLPEYMQHDLWHVKEGNWKDDFHTDIYPYLKSHIEDSFKYFELYPARFVGFSILSVDVWNCAQLYIKHLQENYPDTKIILGGPYITEVAKRWPEKLEEFIFVNGDGEDGLLAAIRGHDHESIGANYPYQLKDINLSPIPDYSDMNIDFYKDKQTYVSMVTSKGCVRNCSFCNVSESWPEFKMKRPERVIAEVQNLIEQTGISNILFTDNLLNGNPKHYKEILKGLKELRKKYPDLMWRGKMVIRRKKVVPTELFDLMIDSGCNIIFFGLESGSEKVRADMNKAGFTNDDFKYHFTELVNRGITFKVTFIVGHITETEEDFMDTMDILQWIVDEGHADKTIVGFNKLGIPKYTQVERELIDLDAQWHDMPWGSEWKTEENDIFIRLDRMDRMATFCKENGFSYELYSHHLVKEYIDNPPEGVIDQFRIPVKNVS